MKSKFIIKLKNDFFLISFLVIGFLTSNLAQNKTAWSIRMAESEMQRHPNCYAYYWDYGTGTTLKGFEALWRFTNNNKYYNYIKNTIDLVVSGSGVISWYNKSDYNLDMINEGRLLLTLYNQTGLAKYKIAADTLRRQLAKQPRVSEGGFWHKKVYPNQMWLDGLFMAEPFYTEYAKIFNEPTDYEDVARQITVMEKHARDTLTGLLYHGWDESKQMAWANATTGCSQCFWGRGMGWYAMALVDVLDYFPEDHTQRPKIIAVLQRLAEAIKKVQDQKYGTWYQVLDQGTRTGNYRESSASCDFVYALAKAVNKGYIDKSYWDVVKKGYAGILNEFITIDADEKINVIQTCQGAGLGGNPFREGTYEYYVDQTRTGISINDSKTVGPFILASIEVEKAGLVIPPLNFTTSINSNGTITISWTDKTYNAVSFIIEKSSDGNNYSQIGSVDKGAVSYIDSHSLIAQKQYYYRVKAMSSNSSSDYSNVSSIIATDVEEEKSIPKNFKLNQNYPNPFNPSTIINYQLPESGFVTLKIYNVLGKEIETLVNEHQQAGDYNLTLDINSLGLSSGVYFYKLQAGNYVQTRKMILLK